MTVPNLNGEWLLQGNEGQPCAIFQQGRVLIFVTQTGSIGAGLFRSKQNIIVPQWQGPTPEGSTASINETGNEINWWNGLTWIRSHDVSKNPELQPIPNPKK